MVVVPLVLAATVAAQTLTSSEGGLGNLQQARAGAVVKIKPGSYGPANLRNLPENLTIDLTGSTVKGLRIYGARGLTIVGATLGPIPDRKGRGMELFDCEGVTIRNLRGVGSGLYVYTSRKIVVDGIEIHGARGFFAEASSDVTVRHGAFIQANADSLNFNGVTNLTIEDSTFIGSGWSPSDPLSNANQHPDAIQGWGDNNGVIVRRVRIAGRNQGVFMKDGANQGVVIEDLTTILDDYKWVVAVQNAVDAPKLRNVKAFRAPGAPSPGLDFRGAKASPAWEDLGGNEIDGRPMKGSDVTLISAAERKRRQAESQP